MKNKVNRLEVIKAVVSSERFGGQEELLARLRQEGFDLTQATLSRDLKFLRIVKVSHPEGGYQYVLPEKVGLVHRETSDRDRTLLAAANGFLSISFSGQLAVIKTRPGYASGTASDIDAHAFTEFIGSLAGDDTVLLVLREGVTHENAMAALRIIIPNISR